MMWRTGGHRRTWLRARPPQTSLAPIGGVPPSAMACTCGCATAGYAKGHRRGVSGRSRLGATATQAPSIATHAPHKGSKTQKKNRGRQRQPSSQLTCRHPTRPPSTPPPHRAAAPNALGKHRLGVEAAVLGWQPTHRAVLDKERVRHGRGGATGAAARAGGAASGGARVRRRRVGGLRVGPRAARRRRGRRARRRGHICWGRHGRHGRSRVGGARGSVTGAAEGQQSAAREQGGRCERGTSCSDLATAGHQSRNARLKLPISTGNRILHIVCR